MAAFGADARGAADEKIRQAAQIVPLEQHEPVFFVGQHVLAEFCAERRQPLGDRGEARFCLGRKACAGAGEIEMVAFEHARLFGRKPEPVLPGLQCVDALEQSVVQIGFAAMARQDRGDLALDRLKLVVGRRAREIEKDLGHPVEAAPAALQRLDRVGEARRLRIGGHGVDIGPSLLEGGLECGPEMTGLDALERRRLEGPGPGVEKRIGVDAGRGHQEFTCWWRRPAARGWRHFLRGPPAAEPVARLGGQEQLPTAVS